MKNNKIQKELRNKISALELEISEKTNALFTVISKHESPLVEKRRWAEWERYISINKELENQVEFYKKSILRKSAQRNDMCYGDSDLKSYVKDNEISNMELESILYGGETYKELKLNITPTSKERNVWSKLSYITLTNLKNNSPTEYDKGHHSKNVSHCANINKNLNVKSNHRSNCSESQNINKKYSLEWRKRSKKKRSKLNSKHLSVQKAAEDVTSLNSINIEKKSFDDFNKDSFLMN